MPSAGLAGTLEPLEAPAPTQQRGPPTWPLYAPSVPPEFVSKARLLVQQFACQGQPMRSSLEAIFKPLRAGMKRGHSPHQRRKDLAEAVRLLDQLPRHGCLVHTRERHRSRRLPDDWRICLASGAFTKVGWRNGLQQSLLIVMLTLKAIKAHATLNCDVMCLIGLHALGRFYQRSLASDEAALFGDLRDLALH
jgi:hypothetical protein